MSEPHDIDPPEAESAARETSVVRSRPWLRRVAKGLAIGALTLAGLLVAVVLLLDTSPGHRLVAERIRGLEFENGLRLSVGRIDGSLYGRMVLRDLSVRDPRGEFLFSPEVRVDWRPLAYLRSHIDIRSATAGRMTLRRVPEFRETAAEEPLLPDLDIDVGELRIVRLITEKPVTGERRVAAITGRAHIADGRAQVKLEGRTLAVAGGAGGDRLSLDLDAVPDRNRLALDLDLHAPRGGVIAAIAGLEQALSVKVTGRGDWKAWNGSLAAVYASSEIARLRLAARDGTFAVEGPARLAPLFEEGVAANLLAPALRINLAAKLEDRSADLSGTVASDAFNLSTNGIVDLSDNTFNDLKLAFVLLEPSGLAENLRGNGLRALLTLDGAFATPRVRYELKARRLVMNDMGLELLNATGAARVDADQIVIPVKATAQRITGLDTIAGGTLTNVRLDGDLAIGRSRILSDNMRIRSDRIDATAILLANLETGLYTGAIDGRIANYRVESVGIFNVTTDLDLESGRRGFALTGRLGARSRQLTNDTLRTYLGGNFAASSDVRYGEDGAFRFSNLRLEAPLLRVVGGQGSYSQDGRIALLANGVSPRYGKVGVRLAGTISNPNAHVTAQRPDLGIGLANLDASIRGARGGYRLDLTADTDYGPLQAEVTLGMRGATTLDINSANLSGVAFAGALRQTRAGPFAGELRANGNGLAGVVRLDAEGRYQAAQFNLRARGTVFDGPAQLVIGSAIVDGRAVFYRRPYIVADIQLADSRIRGFSLAAARAQIDYRDGRGRAKAVVAGASGAPFRLAANAVLEPNLWRVALEGRTRGIAIKTSSPARIIPRNGTYELLPTRIDLGGGNVKLAGAYGDGLKIQSRLEKVDLTVVNAFIPGLGLGGRANGSLDFAQASPASFPRADARLTFDNFTRTTATSVSQPVDVSFVGKLLADGGEGRAVFRRRGSVIGRMAGTLRPLPPGAGPWTQRLLGAPLGGGIRYNGPADTLFSLAGQPGQSLSGPLGFAADFSCRVSDPCLSGIVRGRGLTYTNETYGTRLTNLNLAGRFSGNRLQIETLEASAGNGTVSGSGYIGLAAAEGYPMDMSFTLNRARLARSEGLSASATGSLRLTKAAGETALLSGQLRLPETRYRIVREGAAEVPRLTGVRFKPPRAFDSVTGSEAATSIGSAFDLLRLDVDLVAPDQLYATGMGLESEWRANFTASGTSKEPSLTGTVTLIRGTLGFAGRSFELTEGQVNFTGGRTIDPRIRMVATEDVEDVSVNVNVTGRASDPQIVFTSVPGLPQDEIMSRILFGSSIANLSAIQAVQLATSLSSLRGSGGGLNPLGKLRSAAGIDRLRILGPDEASGRGTALAAGQYLTDDIYVELITDARGFTATQLEISITNWLSVLSQAGGSGVSNAAIRFRKDY